ncbi:galactoside alpha-(1,2)-fucosyltransferase 1 isoform X3 [Manis javanica]|uniref:galactoside alpha-(1,2)-fucosyltransferase 1 isoform X3 n=1 Tax=Manis javanica TaxID=9974 RepID=UPI003C6D44E8
MPHQQPWWALERLPREAPSLGTLIAGGGFPWLPEQPGKQVLHPHPRGRGRGWRISLLVGTMCPGLSQRLGVVRIGTSRCTGQMMNPGTGGEGGKAHPEQLGPVLQRVARAPRPRKTGAARTPAMWVPSRHHLCLTFLLVCVFSAILLIHIHQDLFPVGLDLSVLCPDRHLVTAPVAIFCLSGTPTAPNTSFSCSQHPGNLSGTWTIYPDGRFGNQMGQCATLLALAQLNGRQAFILPAMHAALAPVFRITLPVMASEVDSHTRWRELELHDWMSEEYAHLKDPVLKFTGFPCSWTFFHHLREQIRREFTLHNHLQQEAQGLLSQLRLGRTGNRPGTFVGVHVRRGDYLQVMPDRWKGVVGDGAYLQQAMDWFRARHKAPMFVVTSNGMEWCRENIDTSQGDVTFAGDGQEGSPGKDFALLTQCNHTIMTIGTFGFWAAYLAGGDTVYLANFTLPDSNFLKIFKPAAAFLPEWVGINADLSPLQRLAGP